MVDFFGSGLGGCTARAEEAESVIIVGRPPDAPAVPEALDNVDEDRYRWPGFEARPAAIPMEVCTHRRKGDVCITTLWRLFFVISRMFTSSSVSRARSTLAILAPSALDCVKPP